MCNSGILPTCLSGPQIIIFCEKMYLLLNGFDSGAQMCDVVVLHVDGTHWVLEQVQVVGQLLGEEDVHLLHHRVVLFIRHADLEIKPIFLVGTGGSPLFGTSGQPPSEPLGRLLHSTWLCRTYSILLDISCDKISN